MVGTLPPGAISRGWQFLWAVVALSWSASGCSPSDHAASVAGHRLTELVPPPGAGSRFEGLIRPVAIRSDPFGRIFVADAGDNTVKVFDSLGHYEFGFGGAGTGPGELPDVQDVLPGRASILVHLGAGRRIATYDTGGRFLSLSTSLWPEDSYARLGDSLIVTAADPAWARPSDPQDTAHRPLIAIAEVAHGIRHGVGTSDRRGTPFARHVRNYALLGGRWDGRGVWVAMLNDARIGYYDPADGRLQIWEREVPFRWRSIRLDYVPERHFPRRGGLPLPPFDPVTLSVAVDTNARFYMLTALGTVDNAEVAPSRLAVDVAKPGVREVERYLIDGTATHLAVSPSGAIMYLLDARSATVKMTRGPESAVRVQ